MTKLQSITFHTYSLLKCGRWGGKLGWQAPPCRKGRRPFLSGDSVATAKRSLAAQTVMHNAGDGVATGVRKLMGTPEIVVCTDARCSAL
ncbi:MAG: hypothetical protein PHH38_03935 [Candidatus Cloacimonetes bacterium]|nr:hypothetical protein [Candidatus Cloacimonadota bacterium]